MYRYCIIQNNMYLCNVIEKQTVTKSFRLSKTDNNDLSRYEKSGYYRNTRREKERWNFLRFVAKTKIRFSFRSYKYIQEKKRSLKKYRINV